MAADSPWQDQRRHGRHQGRLDAELLVDGAVWQCRIRDISFGGAGVEPPIPPALGRPVVLSSPALGFDLTGRVINVAYRRTCIVFDLEPAVEAQLLTFLDQRTRLDEKARAT